MTAVLVGDDIPGSVLSELPAGTAVLLVRDHRGRPADRVPSALLRMQDGTWRASDRDDTGRPGADGTYRVLHLGRDIIDPTPAPKKPQCRCPTGTHP